MRLPFLCFAFLLFGGMVWSIVFPPICPVGNYGRRNSCQSNLKQIGLGLNQYVQDYDERYPPPLFSSSTGWAEVVLPYVKSTQLFQCPAAPDHATGFFSDYFYNRHLAHVALDKITTPAKTLMAGDGDDDAPLWSSRVGLPTSAATNPDSPARRHMNAANYLFADGHVKWLKVKEVSGDFRLIKTVPSVVLKIK